MNYNYWCTFNYFNDRIMHLFWTQFFFDVTEFIPAIVLYYLLDKRVILPTSVLIAAQSTNLAHIFLSLKDQGFLNILFLIDTRTIMRDLAFLISDFVCYLYYFYHFERVYDKQRFVYQFSYVAVLTLIYQTIIFFFGYQ